MASVPVPSAEEVRRLLGERLPTAPTFDKFCLDHFPEVHREFASAMDRTTRENLLLAEVGVERVWHALEGRRSPSGPSVLPPNNLPVRNATFVGRGPQLDALHKALMAEGVASVVPRQVYGLGGVGKTSLALEYAHRHANEYPGGLWWVRAEGKPEDALVAFGVELRLAASDPVRRILERTPENAPSAVVAQAVTLALQNHTLPSLLVLDNVSVEGWRTHLPSGAVRVLITTRSGGSIPDAEEIWLEGLSIEESRRLADLLAGPSNDASEQEARDLVLRDDLGGLPVAVEVAARAVARWHLRWAEYRERLLANPDELLDAEDLRGAYPHGALMALDLSIRRVAPGSLARRLLEGAAVFAPDNIPKDWMLSAASAKDDVRSRRSLDSLERLGLLRADQTGDQYSLHRLVRSRVRTLATSRSKESWWRSLWHSLRRRLSGSRWESTRRRALYCARNWMHITVEIGRLAVVEARRHHVEELVESTQSVDERAWSALTDRFATHLWHRAEHAAARGLFERALRADEAALGSFHPVVAISLSNLALVLRALGDAASAKPLLERALRLGEANVGADHPTIAIRLSNLALVYNDLGDAASAKPLLERALRIDEVTFGQNHPEVATDLSNLASVLNCLGDATSAKPLLERALRLGESNFGPHHPYVAASLSNLAVVLKELGDAVSAKPLLERALRINEATFGPTHPHVARDLSNLAVMHLELGDAASAKPLLEQAMAILSARLGPDHPDTKTVRLLLDALRSTPKARRR